ncbi:MAG: MATE family efflux transporter [Eubacteriales bacterium]|nr:MATE family efflux transporter [Eubacteriales bacterium]
MLEGPLLKNVLLFSLPIMLSNLLQIAFNAADTVIVGKFSGQRALAAVGSTGAIVGMLVSLFNGLSVGATIVLAQSLGSGVTKRIKDAVHTAYFLAVSGGLILSVAGFFLSGYLLRSTGTPDDILDQALLYMRIYFAGSIPLFVYNCGASVMRAKGDSVRPTIILMVTGVINVLMNLILVIALKMDVAGVAIATVVSESISAIHITACLMREDDQTRLALRDIRLDRRSLAGILSIGLPAGLQGMMWSLSNVAIQKALNSFGSITVAGNTAAANIEEFVYIGMDGFSQSAMTFTSQNAGAKNVKRIRDILKLTTVLITVVSFVIGAFILFQDDFFLSLYTDDLSVINVGKIRIKYVVFWLFLNGTLDIPSSSMRGMGYSTLPTVFMLIGIVGVRLGWIYLFWYAHPTLEMLYMCFPLSWSVTTVLQFVLWFILYRRFVKECGLPIATAEDGM